MVTCPSPRFPDRSRPCAASISILMVDCTTSLVNDSCLRKAPIVNLHLDIETASLRSLLRYKPPVGSAFDLTILFFDTLFASTSSFKHPSTTSRD